MILSKKAAIEKSSLGIGVSTAARKYWREYFKSVPAVIGRNEEINTYIAADFKSATPVHRFFMHSGEVAEVRKSKNFYYIAATRSGGQFDVIFIQPVIKEPSDEVRKSRLENLEWTKRYYR